MELDNIDGDYMDKRWKAVLIVVLVITGAFLVFSRADENTGNSLYDAIASDPLTEMYTGEHQDSLANAGTEPIRYFVNNNDIVNHNNVRLGDTCWQVLRTTDTGGIKMVYNGEYDSTNKCNKSRGDHMGFIGTEGTDRNNITTLSGEAYVYGSSFSWSGTTFTLQDTTIATWSDSTYTNLMGKYTCMSGGTTCSTLYYIGYRYSSTQAYTTSYTIGNTGYAQIGTSAFNANRYSPAMVGYMFNKSYDYVGNAAADSGALYGSDVIYSNGTYTLTNTSAGKDDNHHYSCNNTTGTCSTVRYYYYNNYYVELSGVANIETAVNQMLYDNDVNKYNSAAKALIESWYAQKLSDYTPLFEDAIYCNDREQSNAVVTEWTSTTNGWNPNGGSLNTYMRFKDWASNSALKCNNTTDQFTVGNTLAPNRYPVGMASYPEFVLIENIELRDAGTYSWLLSNKEFQSTTARKNYVYRTGYGGSGVNNVYSIRPAVSLKQSTEYISGDGSMTDPYVIDVDTRPKIMTSVANGTITASSHVDSGTSKTISYSPKNGYTLKSIKVDGQPINIETYPNSYTFTNITDNHTIKVSYVRANNLHDAIVDDPLTTVYFGQHQDSLSNSGTDTIYYFNSSDDIINHNNVKLDDSCWQVLRTTDTGGVKLIYNGDYDSTNKCNTSRSEHTGFIGTEGTSQVNATDLSGGSYVYGSSFTWSGTTFTLQDTTIATWSDSTYETLIGKYTCKSSSSTCSTLYYVGSRYNSQKAYTTSYTIGNTNYAQIGTSPFNANRYSLAMVGYMFNKSYDYVGNSAPTSGSLMGSDVVYSNGTYTLTNTSTTKNNTHHYSCNNTTGTCSTVRYYYHDNYYVELSGVANIEATINQMLYDNDVNKYNSATKALIDSWYAQKLSSHSKLFEDVIYCNDRVQTNPSANGWNPSGDLSTTIFFPSNYTNTVFKCNSITDQFTTANTKAQLTYPVGLATYPEMNALNNKSARNTGSEYWLLSPTYLYGQNAYVYTVYTDGRFYSRGYYVYSKNGVRPVVSLKSKIEYTSGDGSMNAPYIIDADPLPVITTSVTNGTITESKSVESGSDKTINYSPDNGYVLDSILVDGVAVSTSTYKRSYTFTNVTEDHTISVTYRAGTTATFDTGMVVDAKMKTLAAGTSKTYTAQDTLITAIKRSNTLPSGFTPTDANTVSTSNSPYPIYIFFDANDGTMYYYSEAETVSLNASSSQMFRNMKSLTDISGLSEVDTSNVTGMGSMFNNCSSLVDISALSDWDTSNVTTISYMFSNCSAISDIDALSDWDTSKVTDMSYTFYKCSTLSDLDAISDWNTSKVANTSYMFSNCSALSDIDALSSWDTSKVINISYMFAWCSALSDIDALSNWDTSSATIMRGMFQNCTSLEDIDGASDWDISKVNDVQSMFNSCSNLTDIDGVSNWDTSSVTSADAMFYNCSGLTDLDALSNWDTSMLMEMSQIFYGCNNLANIDGLSSWDTSKVRTMEHAFSNCSALSDIDALSDWDTSKVNVMMSMFAWCTSLTDIDALSNWDTSNVRDMAYMFYDCSNLSDIDGASSWDTLNLTDMSSIFENCSKASGTFPILGNPTTYSQAFKNAATTSGAQINVVYDCSLTDNIDNIIATKSNNSNVVKSNCLNGTRAVFDVGQNVNAKMKTLANGSSKTCYYQDTTIQAIKRSNTLPSGFTPTTANTVSTNLSGYPIYIWWDSSTHTIYYYSEADTVYLNSDSSYMFSSMKSLTDISGLSEMDASNVASMKYTFYNCTNLADIDALSNWDTSKVTNADYMFYSCSAFSDLDALSDWDTSSITSMGAMFYSCSGLTNIDALSDWNVSNVTDMSGVFASCTNLANVDGMSTWNTSNVTTISGIFQNCSNLANIDGLSNWDTSSVINVYGVFENCPKASGTFPILGNPTEYTSAFWYSATVEGAQIIVKYSCLKTKNIDDIIATKSSNSNVVKANRCIMPCVDVTITNELYGNMANLNKNFTYTVEVRDENDVVDTTLSGTFTLANDESEVLSIPVGYSITVTQDSETGYETTVNDTNSRTITKTITDDDTVIYKNTYNISPATGTVTILTPYILLLIFSILTTFGIACVHKRLKLEKS